MNEIIILMTEMYSDETFTLADGFDDAIIGDKTPIWCDNFFLEG